MFAHVYETKFFIWIHNESNKLVCFAVNPYLCQMSSNGKPSEPGLVTIQSHVVFHCVDVAAGIILRKYVIGGKIKC